MAQRAQNGHFGAMSGSGGSKLGEECGTSMEQVRPYLGRCIGISSLVTSDHAPKGQKTFCGNLRVWWLQTGGTVWNKVGTSQGTPSSM